MSADLPDGDAVDRLGHHHRPGLTGEQALHWVVAWGFGLSTLWYAAAGVAALSLYGRHVLGALAIPLVLATSLLLPKVGVLRPGGARAAVILRMALPVGLLATAFVAVAFARLGPDLLDNERWFRVVVALWAVATVSAPLAGVPLAYAVFVRRSEHTTAAIGALSAALLAGAAGASVWGLRSASPPTSPQVAWAFFTALCVAGALAAGVAGRRRYGSLASPERWREGTAEGGHLRVGDAVLPLPEALRGYAGPVSVLREVVAEAAAWRSGRPVDARAVLPCKAEQVRLLVGDARDSWAALVCLCAALAAAGGGVILWLGTR